MYQAHSLSSFAVEAMLRIVRLLEVLPDENFDLSDWFARTDCGTTACAMGTAALHPWFQARGLDLDRPRKTIRFTDTGGHTTYGLFAAVELLDITLDQAMYLFTVEPGYALRKQVIRRICHFVARNGALDTGPLAEPEQRRLKNWQRDLDARLEQERADATEACMRKVNAPLPTLHQETVENV